MPLFLALPFMLALKASLWLIGFGAAGPIAGSLAALIQAVVFGAAVPAGGIAHDVALSIPCFEPPAAVAGLSLATARGLFDIAAELAEGTRISA